MKCKVTALLGLVSLVCMSAFSAAASAADTKGQITDPSVLALMGFPANATHVYQAAVPNTVSDVQKSSDFGTTIQYSTLPAKLFIGRQNTGGTIWNYSGGEEGCCTNLSRTGTEPFADSPLLLPHGVELSGIRIWANDTNAGSDILFFVFEACYPNFGPGATNIVSIANAVGTAGSSGNQSDFANTTLTTIDNVGCVYTVRANFQATTGLTLQKVRMQWQRQITPAPLVASFTDVPTNAQFFREVEALALSGVTSGCTATTFCPENFVTRRQMAAFLSRALGL